jgi:lysophospholipase L1-like esterase
MGARAGLKREYFGQKLLGRLSFVQSRGWRRPATPDLGVAETVTLSSGLDDPAPVGEPVKRHPHTRLVSLMIGYNDLALCQATTSDHCASEFPAVATQASTNVADILGAIRHRAHYRGQVVIVNYYATDYANPADVGFSQGLNAAMDGAAKPFHVKIADGFVALEAAAVPFGGDSCAAGLLTQLTGGGCGIHPSAAGQALLAVAVERVVNK